MRADVKAQCLETQTVFEMQNQGENRIDKKQQRSFVPENVEITKIKPDIMTVLLEKKQKKQGRKENTPQMIQKTQNNTATKVNMINVDQGDRRT